MNSILQHRLQVTEYFTHIQYADVEPSSLDIHEPRVGVSLFPQCIA